MSDDSEIDEKLLARALRTLVDRLPFDVWIRDTDDKALFVNEATRRRWASVAGNTVASTDVNSDIAARWRSNNARALAGETVEDEAVYWIAGRPHTFIGVITSFADETGVRGTVGMNVDVTGERRAQAEAHGLGRLLRDVFTSAPVAMGIRAVRNDDLVHVEDNPCAAALMGSTPEALRGRSERELDVPSEQIARTLARFREARRARGPVTFELSYTDEDGAVRSFEGKAIAIEDPDEERYAFVAADEAELRRLQSGLIRADRLASLGTLSASIGHEIATSAGVALGELELSTKLLEQGSPAHEVLPKLRDAQRALIRAVGVIRDMRALAVGATLGTETCEVASAIDMLSDVLRREIPAHIAFQQICPKGLTVAMSHSRLVQTLLNLVRNAIEALGPTAGKVGVEVSALSDGRIRVDVVDDGPGIPPTVRSKLFQPLVSTKVDGTGLGLYVCSLLVTASGGAIDVLSSEGGGVRMRLDLPAAT